MKPGNCSFRELFGAGQRVEIPVIQRDYAQGREDEHSQDVRKRFIDALGTAFSADSGDTAPLDLDFVYGRWKVTEKTLEPLDGQQRLTTLFLLHWYLASLDDAFEEFRSWITLAGGGSCFTYRTRPAAREFFDALVLQPVPLNALASESRTLSNWVTDSVWFMRNWHRDPTVRGCLTMLDAIHGRFALSKGAWARLVSRESPTIVFRLLLLENLNLSDDLYVKMNARGKALTGFEILKAELEQFVREEFGDERCPHEPVIGWRDYVSRQFDLAWTDLLWKHRGGTTEIDSRFQHLIRALALVRCVGGRDEAALAEQVECLLANPEPGVPLYEDLGCLNRAFIEELVCVLDTLARHEDAPDFLGRSDYLNENDIFRRVLLARSANQAEGLTLADWITFYAWCSFILRFSEDLRSDAARESFHDWIRVVVNLTLNSVIDRNERFVAALHGTRLLSLRCGANFISSVANGAIDECGGFNQQQQREERLKAQLILRNGNWRPLIERAETHRYFRGDTEFLLRFSGVFDRAAQNERCAWSNEEDDALRQSFTEWYDRICAVFPENGMAWPAPFPDFLWERALLATGDYLLQRGRNWSFLDDKDRDASWKRLFRADTRVPDRDARRDVVRRTLLQVDPKDAVGSLRAIVAAGVQGDDAVPVPGFRTHLVLDPRLMEYCHRRMVRLEEDTAFLLTQTQRNGYHVDLYVYALYLRLQARHSELTPFDVTCKHAYSAYPPSQLLLSTPLGLSLSVEKRGVVLQLTLKLSAPNPQLASGLTGWAVVEDNSLCCTVLPDAAEKVILDLAVLVRAFTV